MPQRFLDLLPRPPDETTPGQLTQDAGAPEQQVPIAQPSSADTPPGCRYRTPCDGFGRYRIYSRLPEEAEDQTRIFDRLPEEAEVVTEIRTEQGKPNNESEALVSLVSLRITLQSELIYWCHSSSIRRREASILNLSPIFRLSLCITGNSTQAEKSRSST